MQKKQPWQRHQSVGSTSRGWCCWGKCPGLKNSKAKVKRSYSKIMICEECSAANKANFFICNGSKGGEVLPCHMAYHKAKFNKEFLSIAEG
jgi:hypothetical protein